MANSIPATIALELLPNPLVIGISLSHTKCWGCNVGQTARAVSMIKFSSFVGTASPNGCSIFHLLLGSTTVNVKYKSTAIPMESNPRPILAVVAVQ